MSGKYPRKAFSMSQALILINPWIYDFAAYDFWSKPLGLLYIASYLRQQGFRIHLIDCLHGGRPEVGKRPPTRRAYGTGKFLKEPAAKPPALQHIPRTYSRYGISQDSFLRALRNIRQPAAILVTSAMTYWYPGVQEAIRLARAIHPHVPILLGGLYARLCEDHAHQTSGADRILSDSGLQAMNRIVHVLHKHGMTAEAEAPTLDSLPYPAFDLLHGTPYVSLLTSVGCPYHCRYCATPVIHPRHFSRDPYHVLEEILYWHRDYGIRDYAFYDDALLFRAGTHAAILLEEIIRRHLPVRLHTPNALHVREISAEIARLLHRSGFRTIRLGLETADMEMHQDLDGKISEGEFDRAVMNLRKAGFSKRDIGAYVLVGLPGQSVESVLQTITFVGDTGATPYLAEYSPIPHTALWQKAVEHSSYDLSSEPLFHNNTLLPCWNESRRAHFPKLKQRALEIRRHG
jgi:radical SAM superfamily enzyme YgiQ (UPF0313 family)